MGPFYPDLKAGNGIRTPTGHWQGLSTVWVQRIPLILMIGCRTLPPGMGFYPRPSPSGWNRFQPQIDPVQNRGTFLWTVISKICPRIIRSKIWFLETVTFQSHAHMLICQPAQSLKVMDIFQTLGSRSLSVNAMLIFSGKTNTAIYGLGVDDTAFPVTWRDQLITLKALKYLI